VNPRGCFGFILELAWVQRAQTSMVNSTPFDSFKWALLCPFTRRYSSVNIQLTFGHSYVLELDELFLRYLPSYFDLSRVSLIVGVLCCG
ncbi:hypothetical protein C8F04DRAFT_1143017, partial [Mycena alexandri]